MTEKSPTCMRSFEGLGVSLHISLKLSLSSAELTYYAFSVKTMNNPVYSKDTKKGNCAVI